jgi:hypothetical protein
METDLAISIGSAFLAIAVAIFVPIFIEWKRRPIFSLSVGHTAEGPGPDKLQFLHIKVVNKPLKNPWLLRNTATGCKVSMSFEELGSGKQPVKEAPARWTAAPEPVSVVGSGPGVGLVFDSTKVPFSYKLDVSPDEGGEFLGIVVKYEGEQSAFAFNSDSYIPETGFKRFCISKFELPGDEYEVTIRVASGGVEGSEKFRLKNYGTGLEEFRLEKWDSDE